MDIIKGFLNNGIRCREIVSEYIPKDVEYFELVLPYTSLLSNKKNISHVFEHMMFLGFNGMDVERSLSELKKHIFDINAKTGMNGISIFGYVITDIYSVVDVLAKMIRLSDIPEQLFENEKEVIKNEYADFENDFICSADCRSYFLELIGVDKRFLKVDNYKGDTINSITRTDVVNLKNKIIKNVSPILYRAGGPEVLISGSEKIIVTSNILNKDPEEGVMKLKHMSKTENSFLATGWNMNKCRDISEVASVFITSYVMQDYGTRSSLVEILRSNGLVYSAYTNPHILLGNLLSTIECMSSKKNIIKTLDIIKQYFNRDFKEIIPESYFNRIKTEYIILNKIEVLNIKNMIENFIYYDVSEFWFTIKEIHDEILVLDYNKFIRICNEIYNVERMSSVIYK